MQKIWICGAKGQIGQAINEIIDKLEFKVLDTDIDDLDITDTDEVLRFGEMNRPDIIINCAGLTNIEECENDISKAYKVNALGARNLSIIARKLEAKLVHISTDDVFDGKSDQPYNEFDQTRPQTAYGKSKLAGEQYVKEHTAQEIAEKIQNYFPDTTLESLTKSVQTYKDIEAWKENPILKEEAFDKLQEIMTMAGELTQKVPYEKIVNNSYAEKVIK